MNSLFQCLILSSAVVAAQAQAPEQIIQARITGSKGDSGKCTIEVRVDGIAEVDVYGNTGRLRTLAGQPATWTRMECTDPLPYQMSDFRFRGIDGRGNVQLVQDPRDNNSVAVVHIEDPRGGSEGYTFDLEWSGASGGAPTGGFPTSRAPAVGGGRVIPGRRAVAGITAERAIDLCRAEVHTRAQRDYGMGDIDITAVGVDTGQGRRNWITGAFTEGNFNAARGSGYRFNCAVNYAAGQVSTVEILRADGSALQAGGAISGAYDQTQILRACQDAVVARTSQNGYQNVRFGRMAIDPRRTGWVAGTLTASRGPVTDTFDFSCSMDFRAARVENVEVSRR